MHNFETSNMDYSQLTSDEIQNIKEAEDKINENRSDEIILLAVKPK